VNSGRVAHTLSHATPRRDATIEQHISIANADAS
jgi:hypothetical protein